MKVITVRLNEEEEKMFSEYASIKGNGLSTLLKEALVEKMENEFDLQAIKDYEIRKEKGDIETYSHDEVKKILGL
ncbi:MAG: DUF6290 family protein [Miniphocaeibacter sp.]|uniref:type II toxin-antitoxin system RelB family antitoxin n=1 Tax=Miniphocaeibacter sp. TaxID=3100973 RepID=UPI0017BF9C1D|nr:hypothetical protein [Gallicola sp.]